MNILCYSATSAGLSERTLENLLSPTVWGALGVIAAFVGVIFYAGQARAMRRNLIAQVYLMALEQLDSPEIREGRNYVYHEVKPETHKEEQWANLGQLRPGDACPDYEKWCQHRKLAEVVARSCDRLGLLVREGVIPVNFVARFYASPVVRCWCQLHYYIGTERERRQQYGHLWEWENLVFKIVIKYARRGKGIWKDVSEHDDLQKWFKKAEELKAQRKIIMDDKYNPKTRFWVIKPGLLERLRKPY